MGVDLIHLWAQMGWFAKGIVFVLAIMSVCSLTIMITKWWSFAKRSGDPQVRARVLAVPRGGQPHRGDRAGREATRSRTSPACSAARWPRSSRSSRTATVTVADINSAERAVEREMLMTITRAEARPGRARHGRRHGAVRRPARHHDGHRERVHGHGRVGAPAVSPRSRPVSPRRSSRRRSVCSSPSRRCGRTTTSRPRSTTSRPR